MLHIVSKKLKTGKFRNISLLPPKDVVLQFVSITSFQQICLRNIDGYDENNLITTAMTVQVKLNKIKCKRICIDRGNEMEWRKK